jgi:hypothetical protein
MVRAWPLSLVALALPSFAFLLAAHLTRPLISPPYEPQDWWHWLRSNGLSSTVLDPGGHQWFPAVVIPLVALIAVGAAIVSARMTDRNDFGPALVCVIVWLAALVSFPHLVRSCLGAAAIGAMLAVGLLASRRGALGVALALVLAAALAIVHRHAALSAAVGVGGLALAIAVSRLYISIPLARTRSRRFD